MTQSYRNLPNLCQTSASVASMIDEIMKQEQNSTKDSRVRNVEYPNTYRLISSLNKLEALCNDTKEEILIKSREIITDDSNHFSKEQLTDRQPKTSRVDSHFKVMHAGIFKLLTYHSEA